VKKTRQRRTKRRKQIRWWKFKEVEGSENNRRKWWKDYQKQFNEIRTENVEE